MRQNSFRQSMTKPAMLTLVFAIAVSGVLAGNPPVRASDDFPINTPLWEGPTDIFLRPDLNYLFPELGATYWTTFCTIPEGAKLELVGAFPHARYLSIQSCDAANGVSTDVLKDVDIVPEPGSENPFLPGAKRNVKNRDFVLTIVNEFPPEDPADRIPNTLYAKVVNTEGSNEIALVWRIYARDKNYDITGGVGLPGPRVVLANGVVLDTEASYAALDINPVRTLPPQTMDAATYAYLRSGGLYTQFGFPLPDLATFPAVNPPDLVKVFNLPDLVNYWYLPPPVYAQVRDSSYFVAQFANLDNNYLVALLNRQFGEVVVIRGKAPNTPETYQRDPFMDENVDMRFWSIITAESLATTKTVDGAYDEQIPLDRDGFYTIVVSLDEDRPRNARDKNGVKWLNWGENGDGAGHLDDGLVIFRHMLASPDFEHALQNVTVPAELEAVLGDYLPAIQYMSKEDFEALGQKPWKNLQ